MYLSKERIQVSTMSDIQLPRDLSIGEQRFAELRQEQLVYVDKTAFVAKLVRKGGFYFLSRPRRFGKSLFLTTLKAYFEGKKRVSKVYTLSNGKKRRPYVKDVIRGGSTLCYTSISMQKTTRTVRNCKTLLIATYQCGKRSTG